MRLCSVCGSCKPLAYFQGKLTICIECSDEGIVETASAAGLTYAPPGHRICTREGCAHSGTPQLESEFKTRKDRPCGYRSHCKSCSRSDARRRAALNPETIAAERRRADDKTKAEWPGLTYARKVTLGQYGISPDGYLSMYCMQNGGCAICYTKFKWLWSVAVDHCHVTNKVCGLLCDRCNTMLGLLYEDEAIAMSALRYVRERKTSTRPRNSLCA